MYWQALQIGTAKRWWHDRALGKLLVKKVIATLFSVLLSGMFSCADDVVEPTSQLDRDSERITPTQTDEEQAGRPAAARTDLNKDAGQPLNISRSAEEKASCWVTLDWCSDPDLPGQATCHHSGCTCNQFSEVCKSLALEYCGHGNIAIVC